MYPGRRLSKKCGRIAAADASYSTRTARQILFPDDDLASLLHVDIFDRADTALLVAKLDVIAACLDSGQRQPLIVIDFAFIIILALVGTPHAGAQRSKLQIDDRHAGPVQESEVARLRRGTAQE